MTARSKLSARQWALLAALFAFVVGARWAVVNQFGSDLPIWDQWDAEGVNLLAPWLHHRLTLAMMLAPHNEHRIALTRLLALGLALANGQWDQRLECAVNAVWPALVAVAFLALAHRHCDRKWRPALAVLLMVLFGLPTAWENILRGFDSQQFFLVGLSFGAIALLPEAAPWSRNFWLGTACAVLALGSMATGFFAALVVAALLILRWAQGRSPLRRILPALILCVATVATGWWSRVNVPGHAPLKARDVHDFWLTVRHSLQWPGYGPTWSWMAVVAWLPWTWLTAKVLIGHGVENEPMGLTLAGLGGWVLLQILATAYARGAGGPDPAPRYVDTLVIGSVANALAFVWLWQHGNLGPLSREIVAVSGIAWVALFALTSLENGRRVFLCDLPKERIANYYCEQNTRNYLATGDEAYLRHPEIPYPDASAYIARLRTPGLAALLPVSVRLPLPLAMARASPTYVRCDSRAPERLRLQRGLALVRQPSGFSPATPPLTNSVTWGSFGASGGAGTGEWESRPLHAIRGWLKIEVSGQPGTAGVGIELRDAATGHRLADVQPDKMPGNSWRSAYVRAPGQNFVMVARDPDPARWIAFSQPVEIGPLSYWAWRAVKKGRLLSELAGALALLLAATDGRRKKRA